MLSSLSAQTPTPSKARRITYWIVTGLITFELVHGALWDFNWLNKGYVHSILAHLGYPIYLGSMLGVCKLGAALIILLPRFVLLKEWAYAGVVILFMGGFVSHVLVGDQFGQFIWAFLFGILGIASWVLRPANRRLTANG